MKFKKNIFALFLSFVMLFTMALPSSALVVGDTADISGVYGDRAVVIGKAPDYAGKIITAVLLRGDGNDTSFENVLYLDTVTADNDGYYEIKLKYSDFTVENGVVNNCTLKVKAEGEDITETVLSATVKKSDLLAIDLKASLAESSAQAIAEVNNLYGECLDTVIIIAAYDENNKLIGVSKADKVIEADTDRISVTYENVPEKFERLVAFVWDSVSSLIPYSQQQDIEYADNQIKTVVIHPGSDETMRRFTWYNSQLTFGAKIQYALKAEYEADGGFTDENSVEVDGTTEIPYDNANDLSCKAEISGLELGTEYVYRLGNKYKYDETVYNFKTYDPQNSEKQTFAMVTDLHNRMWDYDFETTPEATYQIKRMSNALNSMMAQHPDIQFMVSTGDNVSQGNMNYSVGADDKTYQKYAELEFDQAFAPEVFQKVPFATTLGNHEIDYTQSAPYSSVTKYHYNLPNDDGRGEVINGNSHGNFWFRNGDVLIIGIHATMFTDADHDGRMANTTAAKNKEYIEETITKNTDAKWRILVNHVPGYAFTGAMKETSKLRQVLSDMDIDSFDFDVVFTGHQHTFSRSKQLLVSDDSNKVTYGDYEMIKPTVVENAIESSTDENGYQIDIANDPDGTVYISMPSIKSAGGNEVIPDYKEFLEAYGDSDNSDNVYSHDGNAFSDENAMTVTSFCYTLVTVEKTDAGQQMKIELIQSNATRDRFSETGDVWDTYIINKTIE